MSGHDCVASHPGQDSKLLLWEHLFGISLYFSVCNLCFLFSPFLPHVPRTNLCFLTSLLSCYLPANLAAASPCVTGWPFQSPSLHPVIVRTHSCRVADSWGRQSQNVVGALPGVAFPGFVEKEQSFSSISALVNEIDS